MTNYAKHFSAPNKTPQTERAKESQVQNSAGGFTFALDKWGRLQRFLILGNEGGTYYASEKKLTKENASCVQTCIAEDPERTVAEIVAISDSGRAPKNDPAIFALAIAAGSANDRARAAALSALPKVARIGTHLFKFVDDVKLFRGWGRGLQTAIGRWYNEKTAEEVAFQAVKYQQRGGRSHRDVLRLAHPKPISDRHEAAYRWMTAGAEGLDKPSKHGKPIAEALLPSYIEGFEKMKRAATTKEVVSLLKNYRLPHECVDGKWKGTKEVWDALLPEMGMTALIRNLGKMSSVGMFEPMSAAEKLVVSKIVDKAALKKGRVHPLAILMAQRTYVSGHGDKGKLSWTVSRAISNALDEAFYLAFETVEPTGKNIFLAFDVSGSMDCGDIAGSRLTPREASAAMGMVMACTEKHYFSAGFTSGSSGHAMWSPRSNGLTEFSIGKKDKLANVIARMSAMPMGGTDCSLPMRYATEKKMEVDAFVVYTDCETWAGPVHPFQALKEYRQKMGRPAKLIVVGMTATEFTIADPSDAGMMDVVGFDTAAPALMADFIRE